MEPDKRVAGERVRVENYCISFKKFVGLVARQEKFEGVVVEKNGATRSQFSRISKFCVIWPGEFSQPHQSKESNAKLGAEKKIIMGRVERVRDTHSIQIRNGKGPLTNCG